MSRTITTRTAAIGAGLLIVASVASAIAFNSAAAGAAVRPSTHSVVHKAAHPAAAAPAATSSKIYLVIAGFKGDVTDKAHPGASYVSSIQLGMGRGNTDSPASFSEITISKPVDSATAKVMLAVAQGATIPKVDIYVTGATGAAAGKLITHYQLQQVYVTGESVSTSGTQESESLSLHFNKISFFKPSPKSGGTPSSFNWDIAANDTF